MPARCYRTVSIRDVTALFFALLALLTFPPTLVLAGTAAPASLPAKQASPKSSLTIPAGTILPVVLRTTIRASSAAQGQIVRGEIAQDVALDGIPKIHKGSKIEGQVVQVVPAANGAGPRISIRFDKLHVNGQVLPITTDLRAIAGFMAVLQASIPDMGVGEGEVSNWMTTTQIGGDSVYGVGGKVESANGQVVGRSLISGGVLVEPLSNGACRGAIDGNNSPQSLWVFSSNACGTYGLESVQISHAGRSEPAGTFTLDLQSHKTKIQDGAGMLLRVIG
jgi:hypothetical protein